MILLLSRPVPKTTVSKKKADQSQKRKQTNSAVSRLSDILTEFELSYKLGPNLTPSQLLKLKNEFSKIVN